MSCEKRTKRGGRGALGAAMLAAAGIVLGSAALEYRASADEPSPASISPRAPTTKTTSETKQEEKKMPALQFKMKDIDGNLQNLAQYHGNVILMVNVASYCGLTPQYEGLQELYEKYKDQGFVVLGFPANEFGRQEPGTDSEIKDFCSKNFKVTFPMFSKIVVKGDGINPLYAYLTSKDAGHDHGGEIAWNFNKFLIDREGKVVGRFEPRVAPDAEPLVDAVRQELEKPIPDGSPLAKQMKKPKKGEAEKKPVRRGH